MDPILLKGRKFIAGDDHEVQFLVDNWCTEFVQRVDGLLWVRYGSVFNIKATDLGVRHGRDVGARYDVRTWLFSFDARASMYGDCETRKVSVLLREEI